MCVSAVTDELIAAGSIVTTKANGGIEIKITDENGYEVSTNRYHFVSDWSDDENAQKMDIYRSYGNGELYKQGLSFTLDTANRYDPIITAKGIGQLTKTEVSALINSIMEYQEYVVTEVTEGRYRFLETITFRDKEAVEEEAAEAKRQAKSKEMANSLIS